MTETPPTDVQDGARRFRRTLVRVLGVQVVTLIVLWIVQHHFSP